MSEKQGDDEQSVIELSQMGRVATITLNRPKALNAITPAMMLLLGKSLDRVAADDSVGVTILTGTGRAFSAGVDLKTVVGRPVDRGDVGIDLNAAARAVIRQLTTIPKVVIAKVNGFCFTGALELLLACDLVVVANEAKLGDTHAKWGLVPAWGMSQRLVRIMGPGRARELSYTARTFTGAEAAKWGLANQAVPLAELDDTVAGLAETILANSAGSIAAYKDLYAHALDSTLSVGLDYEAATTYEINDAGGRLATFG